MRRKITRLTAADFRNYENLTVEPGSNLTILLGPNGAGKTNVIEAIALLTQGDSFRTQTWSDVVRWGAERASVALLAEGEDQGPVTISLVVEGGRRSYRVNGTVKRRIADVAGTLPSVVFTPDDLRMVKGAAERRRAALDTLGTQISSAYGTVRAEYDRILRQRNALLRSGDASDEELASWTDRLAETGGRLREHRRRLFALHAPHVGAIYAALSGGEGLTTGYQDRDGEPPEAGADGPDETTRIRAAALMRAREERARATTLVGPHRDDLTFAVNGKDARAFASQGQQRTIALAWKLAEIEVIEETAGQTPVLLLDDVMSELDEDRRRALAQFVGTRTQTFVTTTNLGYFEPALVTGATIVELGA